MLLHKKIIIGLKVMLCPVVDPNWLYPYNQRAGPTSVWRGMIGLQFGAAQWSAWFAAYNKFVVHFAALAESLKVEQFAFGSELVVAFLQESHCRETVSQIRAVFSGSLTIAAATENFTDISWFDTLDIIGVDGYYILNVSTPSTVEALVNAWQPIIQVLEGVHKQWNKTIMFTEVGYTSSYQPYLHPWEMVLISFNDCSVWPLCVFLQEQANCYEALFQALYPLEWFGGVHWWLWRTDPLDGGTSDPGFSPVNKPAEAILRQWYTGN